MSILQELFLNQQQSNQCCINPSLYKTLQSSLGSSSSSHYNGVTDESLEQMMKKNEETLKELEEKVEKCTIVNSLSVFNWQ